MRNNIFISYDHILFLRGWELTQAHKHKMKHVTIAVKGEMKCNLGKDKVTTYGYILKEDVNHERYEENEVTNKMVFLIEPSSRLSKEIDILLGNEDYYLLSKNQVNSIEELWQNRMCEPINIENYNDTIERIFSICGLKRDKPSIIDKRISIAIDVINNTDIINKNLLEEIIEKINLSKSRFLHLFKENIGISFKDFILTKKFLKTWTYLGQGESITDACIHGGFFDSAHYTHFMSQCFGLTTKDELKNIDSIYVIDKF